MVNLNIECTPEQAKKIDDYLKQKPRCTKIDDYMFFVSMYMFIFLLIYMGWAFEILTLNIAAITVIIIVIIHYTGMRLLEKEEQPKG